MFGSIINKIICCINAPIPSNIYSTRLNVLFAVMLAFPDTVRLSFVPQVKSLTESLLLKSPPTLRLKLLVVIVPLKSANNFIYNRPNNDFIWGANDTLTVLGTASVVADSFENSGTLVLITLMQQ